MATPVVAPQAPSYATYIPYITPAEFLFAPTGVDVTQLVPGGDAQTNAAALVQKIAQASSEADRIAQKALAATVDVRSGRFRVHADGRLRVPVPYAPLIQINDVSVGASPADLLSLPNLGVIEFESDNVAVIPLAAAGGPAWAAGSVWVRMTYVNGYANTLTGQDVQAGSSAITVTSTLGIVPGLSMTVYDGAATEGVVVAPDYQLGTSPVLLAAPCTSAHAAGVSVSSLEPWVKQAVIYLTAAAIKTRGSEAFAMASITDEPKTEQPSEPGGLTEYARAVAALSTLRRVV